MSSNEYEGPEDEDEDGEEIPILFEEDEFSDEDGQRYMAEYLSEVFKRYLGVNLGTKQILEGLKFCEYQLDFDKERNVPKALSSMTYKLDFDSETAIDLRKYRITKRSN